MVKYVQTDKTSWTFRRLTTCYSDDVIYAVKLSDHFLQVQFIANFGKYAAYACDLEFFFLVFTLGCAMSKKNLPTL